MTAPDDRPPDDRLPDDRLPDDRPPDDRPIDRLLALMARLRDPQGGCPWDLEQTFDTIVPYTIEEAYEVADAVARGDLAGFREELGDLLLQVVFQSQIAAERGLFDFEQVAESIGDKLIRRHPHVFGDTVVADAAAQTLAWKALKAAERDAKAKSKVDDDPPSVLDDVPVTLPALSRAVKLQKRAARIGFDWNEATQVLEKIREEIDELEQEMVLDAKAQMTEEMGDLLFACANLARKLDIDPETALRDANRKFERRFRAIEGRTREQGPYPLPLELLEAAWSAVKADEKSSSSD